MSTFGVVVKWSLRPSVASETLAGPGQRDTGSQLNRNAEGLTVGRTGKPRWDWLGVMDSKVVGHGNLLRRAEINGRGARRVVSNEL
jgi:hypothetical protein